MTAVAATHEPAELLRDEDAALARLRAWGHQLETSGPGDAVVAPQRRLFLFRSRLREMAFSLELPCPWIILILRGEKRVEADTAPRPSPLARACDVLLLPGGVPLQVANAVDPESGIYEAICVEALADAQALLARHYPEETWPLAPWLAGAPVVLRAELPALQAFEHVCATALAPTFDPRLLSHRIEGLLLALAVQAGAPEDRASAGQARLDLALAIRNLVRAEPARPWSAAELARRLRVSQATMRRRLAASGTNLRELIAHERMSLARVLLADRQLGVADVALRCGYESPTKFARQFARWAGERPSQWRARLHPPGACVTG